MGNATGLGSFCADDGFLRRSKRKLVRDGLVAWQVFDPREIDRTLSFTFQNDNLKTQQGIERFQLDKMLKSGDLPGICLLTFGDLTKKLKPPLPPRYEPDEEDEKYGHLHCVTDLPRDQDHMRLLATLATDNGVVRDFVRHKKRRDL